MAQALYEIGDVPPLGEVPEKMYASVIRQDRFGQPKDAFRTEVVDVPKPGRGQVLVYVMAAGINYNNVWAASGGPIDVIAMRQKMFGATEDFHIGGSDGSGVVWAVGDGVEHVKVGDPVVMSGGQYKENDPDLRLGADPLYLKSIQAWGYETNYGSFAQFALVDEYQCLPKPSNLSWEDSGSLLVTAATAYRMLTHWDPHTVRPGDPVLIWGGAGGLGSAAIQLVKYRGGIPIAVVSDDVRGEYCLKLGAKGVINRKEFSHWGRLPDTGDEEASRAWLAEARRFGKKIWEILGERKAPKIVLEHSGQDTLPTSLFVCDTGGMVVLCGGTSGYNGDIDLRYLWMRSKRVQGSHGSTNKQNRELLQLVSDGRIDSCVEFCGSFSEIGDAHQMLHDNNHPMGNMAVLVNAARRGETTFTAGSGS
ncbi:crotonyl-CoA carboxylase/reductase [Amycolatopsis sp. NPDC057786]|uniref:crotonyl-CoA carboxylase/reductase n=1 Tax=Amycolatopsis sp. NPDC057786 TaxID=3346250 RepID=UPI003671924D